MSAAAEPRALPWYVLINPPWYDDHEDRGYAWSGLAADEADAVAQACAECDAINDRDPEEDEPTDPLTVDVWDADIDTEPLALAAYKAWTPTAGAREQWPAAFLDLRAGLVARRLIDEAD